MVGVIALKDFDVDAFFVVDITNGTCLESLIQGLHVVSPLLELHPVEGIFRHASIRQSLRYQLRQELV